MCARATIFKYNTRQSSEQQCSTPISKQELCYLKTTIKTGSDKGLYTSHFIIIVIGKIIYYNVVKGVQNSEEVSTGNIRKLVYRIIQLEMVKFRRINRNQLKILHSVYICVGKSRIELMKENAQDCYNANKEDSISWTVILLFRIHKNNCSPL